MIERTRRSNRNQLLIEHQCTHTCVAMHMLSVIDLFQLRILPCHARHIGRQECTVVIGR